jgi:hypothetical protein
MYNLKELVKDTTVSFIEYRKGNLWYKVDGTNFEFPVPITDIGDGIFKNSDKGLLFMRYIRKHLEDI